MNNSNDPATQNVVIENVSPDSMKINVNGEVREIRNGLDELKALLQNLNLENFKSGDKIYNIGSITNAVFSAEVGKKTFNMYLCRKLTEALREYNPDVKNFLENKIKEKDKADWETQRTYFIKASQFIISSYVGVLGILLQKLISSGMAAFASGNTKDYLEVCIATTKRTLQLICYSFISKLWDHKKENKFDLTRSQQNDLDSFFTTDIEMSIADHVNLLKTLAAIFEEQKIAYPFPELNKDLLNNDSAFIKASKALKEINTKLDNGQFTLATAFEAEQELTTFLSAVNFLAGYKMVLVKNISYEEVRNSDPRYLHAYTFLGEDSDKLYSSKYKYDNKPICSDGVFIFKTRYQDGLNLFPFIIDYNALVDEQEVKICFYNCAEDSKKRIIYSDISKISTGINDTSLEQVNYNDEVENDMKDNDITRIKINSAKYKEMKLHVLYKIYQQAKEELLA